MECESCEVLYINSVESHEDGCPDAWRNYKVECKWCGQEFRPETKGQGCCSINCADAYYG